MFFEKRRAADRLEGVEHRLPILLLHVDTELADETGLVAGLAQQHRITRLTEPAVDRASAEGELMRTLVKAGQDRGPAGSTDRSSHEHIAEPDALLGQAVEGRRFQKWMTGTAKTIPAVVVGQEENDVGLFFRLGQGLGRGKREDGHEP